MDIEFTWNNGHILTAKGYNQNIVSKSLVSVKKMIWRLLNESDESSKT